MELINDIVSKLKEASDAYYNSDKVIMSNDSYDALVDTLRKLDPENEYLKVVGAPARSNSNKVARVIPMGTLSKYHQEAHVQEWLDAHRSDTYNILLCPKYDGFGVELLYKDGRLVMASTRGTGDVGEDVTAAMMKVHNVPMVLPDGYKDLVRVRGEAIIPRSNHERAKEMGYSAMRNAVPGIVRSDNTLALTLVDFLAYEFFDGRDSRSEQRFDYKDLFTVEDFKIFKYQGDISDILEYRNQFGEKKEEYLYECDGMVIKTDLIMEDDLYHPSHQIAWKYKSNRESTILREVEFNMGVSGRFTPIGHFDEVEFQGAKLKRASLGSMSRFYKEFEGVTIGSVVEVSRRGDIIPYIEELIMIDESGDPISKMEFCPHCGEELYYDGLEPVCLNKSCPEKLRMQIIQYARAIGVKGIGSGLVTGLVSEGYLKSITDIYEINPEVLYEIPRQGKSAVEKWKTLQEKELSTIQVFTYYPFLDLGPKIWKVLFDNFTVEEILNLDENDEKLWRIKGIGSSKIHSLVSQLKENKEEIQYILDYMKNR